MTVSYHIPLAIIGVYLLTFAVIGAYEAKGGISTDPSEYFLAGRGLGTVVLLFTILATVQSSWSFFGGPGFAYANGIGTAAIGVSNLFIIVLAYFIGLRLWKVSKENDLITPVEFLHKRTDSRVAGFVFLVISVGLVIPYIALQPMAGGIIFDVLTNGLISTDMGAIITIVIMTAYVLVAGMRGVAWTDTLQGIIMTVVLIAALIAFVWTSFGSFGNLESVILENPEQFSTPGPTGFWTPVEYFSWIFFMALGTTVFPQVLVRYMAADRAITLKRSVFMYGAIAAIFHFLLLPMLGALGSVAFPGLESADDLFVVLVTDVFGVVLSAIILGGALSAMISTADSQLLLLSQLLTRDGYKEYVNPDASPQRETRVARLIILLLGGVAGVISLFQPKYILLLGELLFTGFAVTTIPLMAALYWRRVTSTGIIAALVGGEVTAALLLFGVLPSPVHASLPSVAITVLLLVGVSLVTDPPAEETIDRYGTV